MNRTVFVSARAQNDLRRIRAYIGMDSPLNAERFLDRLLREINGLADYGHSVALAPEAHRFKFELRQIVVWPYRILFQVSGAELRILHVRHGSRRPASPDAKGNPK